jgi:hypothetical protein
MVFLGTTAVMILAALDLCTGIPANPGIDYTMEIAPDMRCG